MVSGVHCGVPIVERSFSAEPLQLPILCSAVPASAGAPPYLPGYQHCPRSLTRLCPEPCLPSSPPYSSCIAGLAQLCILSNDCDISALDISIVVSQTLNLSTILLGQRRNQLAPSTSILMRSKVGRKGGKSERFEFPRSGFKGDRCSSLGRRRWSLSSAAATLVRRIALLFLSGEWQRKSDRPRLGDRPPQSLVCARSILRSAIQGLGLQHCVGNVTLIEGWCPYYRHYYERAAGNNEFLNIICAFHLQTKCPSWNENSSMSMIEKELFLVTLFSL